jgi:hypothetical protein
VKKKALTTLIIAALIINIVVLIFKFPLVKMLRDIVFEGNENSIFLVSGMDKLLDKLNPAGNIFVRFEGFKSEIGAGWGAPEDVASIMFFRIVYHLYPRMVFAGPEDMKIVRGVEFINRNFQPNEDWLKNKNIVGLLVFVRSPHGEVSWEYKSVGDLK